MRGLGFTLEVAAILAVAGPGMALLTWPVLGALGRTGGRLAPYRTEVAFVLGCLPAASAIATLFAVLGPPLQAAVWGAADHCAAHTHHLHLCFLHPAQLRPVVAALGAGWLAYFLIRVGRLLAGWHVEARAVRTLESMGRPYEGRAFPTCVVPGSGWWCFAAGSRRRRVVLSEGLLRGLEPSELEAALAHEEAHLFRRDPLVQCWLALAGAFSLPWISARAEAALRMAGEEASDAAAAARVGDGALVARALVKVAGAQRSERSRGARVSFGAHPLERRVLLLLSDCAGVAQIKSRAVAAGVGLLTLALTVALFASAELHHTVETLLHHLF